MRTWAKLLFLLIVLCASPAHAQTVTPLLVDSVDQIPEGPLKSYLTSTHRLPMDLSRSPELRPFVERTAGLLRRMLLPRDGTAPIHFVLTDDTRPNASFVTLDNGERVVTINMGLARMVDNDDELAFVLGHELEHGPSELQKYINELNRAQTSGKDNLLARGLQRTVENEADARSVLNRVFDIGLNPHAGLHLTDRLRTIFGEGISATHTSASSRNHVLGMVLAHLSRVAGRTIPEDRQDAFQRKVLGGLHENFLRQKQFAQEQRLRIETVIAHISVPNIQEVYIAIRDDSPQSVPKNLQYEDNFNRTWAQIRVLGGNLISEEALLDYQLQIHERLDGLFEQSRREILGVDFRPKTAEQFRALLRNDQRSYELVGNGSISHIYTYLKNAEREESKYAAASRYSNPNKNAESESLLADARRKLVSARRLYAIARSIYVSEDQTLERLLSELESARSSSNQKNLRGLTDQLDSMARTVGPFRIRNRKRYDETVRLNVDIILDHIEKNFMAANLNPLNLFFSLPQELIQANVGKAFKRVIRSMKATVKDTSPRESIPTFIHHWSNYETNLQKIFVEYYKQDREAALADFKDYYSFLISQTRGYDDARNLFLGTEHVRNHSDSIHFTGVAGLQFQPEFARSLFDEKIFGKYLAKQMQVLTKITTVSPPLELPFFLTLMVNLTRALSSMVREGIVSAETITQNPAWHEFLAGIHATTRNILSQGQTDPISLRQAQSFLAARLPFLYELSTNKSRPSHEEIKSDLLELSQNQGLRERLKGSLVFSYLHNLLSGNRLGGGEKHYSFFQKTEALYDLGYREHGHETTAEVRQTVFNHLDFAQWLRRQPDANPKPIISLLSPGISFDNPDLVRTNREYLSERSRFYDRQFAHLDHRTRAYNAHALLWHEFDSWYDSEFIGKMRDDYRGWAPSEPQARMDYLLGYYEGLQKYILEKHKRFIPENSDQIWRRFPKEWFAELIQNHQVIDHVNPSTLVDALKLSLEMEQPSVANDAFFEYVWRRTQDHPDVRERLMSESLVGRLFYDENKMTLARWQLNQRFHIDELSPHNHATDGARPAGTRIRPIVREIRDSIVKQFPDYSGLRNDILGYVENSMVTTAHETDFLGKERLTTDNWQKSRKLAVLDLPQTLNQHMQGNFDRLELIRYLTGISTEEPRFVTRAPGSQQQLNHVRSGIVAARRHFVSSDIHTRTYVLQALLDSKNGILSDPASTAQLIDTILGRHARDEIYRAVFTSYLDSLPPSESRVVIGHVLSSFANQAQSGAKQVSVKTILEAMGPFGIKAGQFLRTSGLASEAMRAELDHFFDHAVPPSRPEIFSRLRAVFGDKLSGLPAVRQLLGSGSINYVVLVELQDTRSSKPRKVAVRIARDAVEGRVANEASIWAKAITKLRGHSRGKIQRLGNLLEEARAHSMATLGANGPELNLEADRALYEDAAASYQSAEHAETGFRIEAVRPDLNAQKIVPKEFSKNISVYEYVEGKSLKNIADANLRQMLAVQIMNSELNALFRNGVFDPDGHPGNWIIDERGKRLVRLDYSQLRRLNPRDLGAVRQTFTALLRPNLGPAEVQVLTTHLNEIFEIQGESQLRWDAILRDIVNRSDFPDFRAPHDRLFFIREKLDEVLSERGNSGVQIRLKDSMRSALSSIARIMVYREQAGELAAAQAFIENLGLDPLSYMTEAMAYIEDRENYGSATSDAQREPHPLGGMVGCVTGGLESILTNSKNR